MGKRYSDLEKAYNTLSSINFDFDQFPVDNEYRKYKEWKQTPSLRKPRTAPPASGRKSNIGLSAFGLDDTGNADHTLVKIGSRALAQYNSIGDNAVFGLTVSSVPATYVRRAGFIPAKVILGRRNGTGTPTSRATGKQYKKVVSESFTIPFGKTGSGETTFEFGAQNEILRTAALANDYVISFTPEKVSRG